MKKQFAILATIVAVLFAPLCLTAQQPAHKPTPQQPATSVSVLARAESIQNIESPDIHSLKIQLKQYHECTCKCGCYARDLDRQADRAIAFLRARAAHRRPQEKLALVLDIDETTLSNYEELLREDFAHNDSAFDAWIKSAQAPAIPGTLRLYNEAQRLGVSVFFITGRRESKKKQLLVPTETDLRNHGFKNWHQLILRSAAQESLTALEYKSAARASIVAQGYTIVLNVGDQWSDLGGKPEAELSVKYPDPYYFIP